MNDSANHLHLKCMTGSSCLPLDLQASAELASLQSSLLSTLGLRIRHNVHRLGGHHWEILGMALSPDGGILATGGRDQVVCLWDYVQGRSLMTLSGHRDWVWCVAFSPDGSHLVSSGREGRIILWDVAKGTQLAEVQAHQGAAHAVAFDASGSQLYSVGGDGFLKAWDAMTLAGRWSVRAHGSPCRSLVLEDGVIHTVGEDGRLAAWDPALGGALGDPVDLHKPLYVVRALGSTCFVGGEEGLLVAVEGGSIVRHYRAHGERVRSLSLDSKSLFSGSDDGTDCVWDIETTELRYRYGNPSGVIYGARFSQDGRSIWVASNPRVGCLDVVSGMTIQNFCGFKENVFSMVFAQDANRVVAADWRGWVAAWEPSTGAVIVPARKLEGLDHPYSLAITRDGSRYAIGDWDGYVQIRSLPSNDLLLRFRAHVGSVNALAFSVDGTALFTGHRGSKNNLRVWNLDVLLKSEAWPEDDDFLWEGVQSHPAFRYGCWAHTDTIFSLEVSSDGRLLASGSGDGSVCVWDLEWAENDPQVTATRRFDQPLWRMAGHSDWVRSVRFSPDGSRLLTGCNDGGVRLFDVKRGTLIRTFEGCKHHVLSVDFHPTEPHVIAGAWDRTLRMWNLESGNMEQIWEPTGKLALPSFRPVLVNPRDSTLICGGVRAIRCFHPGSHAPFRIIDTQALAIAAMLPVPGTDSLILGCSIHLMELDLQTGQVRLLKRGNTNAYTTLALNPGGTLLAYHDVGTASGSVFNAYGFGKNRDVNFCQSPSGVYSFAFLRDGIGLLAGCHDGNIYLWDTEHGGTKVTWKGHENIVWGISASRNGRFVASASADRTVRIWDAKSGKSLRTLKGHLGVVKQVLVGGGWIYSGSEDCTVRVWDLESGACLRVLRTESAVSSLSLSPNGERLACGLEDGRLLVWKTSDFEKELERFLDTSRTQITGLAWCGRHLARACAMGTLTFLDAKEYRTLATFHALEQGFLWTTPPDEAAPNGWLWTDRPELINVLECEEDGSHPRALPADDPARIDHLKLYNSERMVMMRLNDPEAYRREVSGLRQLAGASRMLPALRDSS